MKRQYEKQKSEKEPNKKEVTGIQKRNFSVWIRKLKNKMVNWKKISYSAAKGKREVENGRKIKKHEVQKEKPERTPSSARKKNGENQRKESDDV